MRAAHALRALCALWALGSACFERCVCAVGALLRFERCALPPGPASSLWCSWGLLLPLKGSGQTGVAALTCPLLAVFLPLCVRAGDIAFTKHDTPMFYARDGDTPEAWSSIPKVRKCLLACLLACASKH